MTYPPATRRDHERFCVIEGWTKRATATGKTGTHHANYELGLPDGRILLTRISHPVDRTDYGPAIWAHILRDQLAVSEGVFWTCVQEKQLPDRGSPEQPADALPADLVHQLVVRFKVSEDEVRSMTKEQAIARLTELWSRPT